MAHKHKSRKGSRKGHRRHHKQRGGYPAPDPSSYSSAATYQLAVNGDGNSQYNRVFDINGPDGKIPGNQIVGLQGQNLGFPPSVSMKGGRRKRRGGNFGNVINQAVVPLGLLAMQQTFRRGKKGGKKTRKHRKH